MWTSKLHWRQSTRVSGLPLVHAFLITSYMGDRTKCPRTECPRTECTRLKLTTIRVMVKVEVRFRVGLGSGIGIMVSVRFCIGLSW